MLIALSRIGTLRPTPNASSNAKPNGTEPIAALAVRDASNAGAQNGHAITENGMPNKKAPQTPGT